MKQTVLNIMKASGAFAPFRIANRNKALIVLYHRFNENKDERTISAPIFREQLDYLAARYRLVPLSFVGELLASGKSLPPGLAVITIDDGYRDAYEIAFPVLRDRKAPATLFVVADFVDKKIWLWPDKLRYSISLTQKNILEQEIDGRAFRFELNGRASRLEAAHQMNSALKQMADEAKDKAIDEIASALAVELPAAPPLEYGPISWAQAREMDAAGIEIGSHTLSHPILTNIDGERLRRELTDSKSKLESILGRSVDLFCYPNGDSNDSVEREVARAGYRCAVTTEQGLNDEHSNPLALMRIPTAHQLARFAQSTSGFEQVKVRIIGARAGARIGRSQENQIGL
jgi:peptidoglycan/xylan/chitin deacetylase (PgdA/CDA1 family)